MRWIGIALLQYVLLGGGIVAPRGGVTFNNANTPTFQAGASYSHAFAVTAGGENLVAFATLNWDYAGTLSVSSITYGGSAMTACGAAEQVNTGSRMLYVQAYYLVGPPTGSNTLAVSIPSAHEVVANLVSVAGANQSTPVRAGTYQVQTTSANQHPSM